MQTINARIQRAGDPNGQPIVVELPAAAVELALEHHANEMSAALHELAIVFGDNSAARMRTLDVEELLTVQGELERVWRATDVLLTARPPAEWEIHESDDGA